MALQYSVAVNNARLDAIETAVGASPVLEIRSGAPPANAAAADTGVLLASINLPADWMTAAASGVKAKNGTWQDASADASGIAGHFRVKQGGTTHIQGTVGEGTGDLQVDNTDFNAGQSFTVTGFSITAANT